MGNIQQNNKQVLLTTLASQEPKLQAGIKAILGDRLIFDSLDRAINNLANANNDSSLNSVEAALESTITRVRELNESKNEHMDDEKASLYLYTLQNLIFCLSDWQFENGNKNQYVPQVAKKFNTVMMRAAEIGLDLDTVQKKCFAHQYKVTKDPILSTFELLDHGKMDLLLQGIQRYQSFGDKLLKDDLNSPEKEVANGMIDHGDLSLHEVKEQNLDRLIDEMTQRFGEESMALRTINDNLNTFYHMIGTCTNHNDLASIKKFAAEIVKRLWEHQKERAQQNQTLPVTQTGDATQK